jgi:hypothetical protein
MAEQKPSNSGEFCYVACKLPNGLILRLPQLDGDGKPFKVEPGAAPLWDDKRIVLKGYQSADKENVIFGHGVTSQVPRDFMEAWLKMNERSDVVKKGLVFIMPNRASLTDRARDQQANRSGFEGIDPDTDPIAKGKIKQVPKNDDTTDL